MDEIKSKYFNFNQSSKFKDHLISEYEGWNSLLVTKFEIKKEKILTSENINLQYPELNGKQKIFVITQGNLQIKLTLIQER